MWHNRGDASIYGKPIVFIPFYLDARMRERVLHLAGFHWIHFSAVLFWLAWSLVIALAGHCFFRLTVPDVAVATVFYLLIALLVLVTHCLRRLWTEMGVSEKRIFIRTGWRWRKTRHISLVDLECMDLKRGLFGRALGYGTLVCQDWTGKELIFNRIGAPGFLMEKVQRQVFQALKSATAQEIVLQELQPAALPGMASDFSLARRWIQTKARLRAQVEQAGNVAVAWVRGVQGALGTLGVRARLGGGHLHIPAYTRSVRESGFHLSGTLFSALWKGPPRTSS